MREDRQNVTNPDVQMDEGELAIGGSLKLKLLACH